MKITILTGIFPPDIGGPAIYTEKLATELVRRRFDIKVITYSDVKNSKFKTQKSKPQFKIKKISKKYPKGLRHLLYFRHTLWLAKDTDVIYAQNLFSVGIPGLIASKILRKKFVVKIVGDYAWEQSLMRGWFSGEIDEFQEAKSFRINLIKKTQKILALSADAIITPSHYLENIIMGWGVPQSKIRVIYNAIEEMPKLEISKSEAREKIGAEGDIILSVGRLAPWKGFDVLIEIMPDLLKENPNFQLLIVGEGPEEKKLKAQISRLRQGFGGQANLKLQNRVKLIGRVRHEEMPTYLEAADLFVLNTGYEGFPHVVLEAMQSGLPIITTKKGGNPEVIEDGVNGILVEYNNKKELKEAILRLWQNRELQTKFIQNSKEKIKEFNWENLLENTIAVLKPKKKVLFIGVTKYNFKDFPPVHLEKKWAGLGKEMEIFILAKGRPSHKKIWGVDFYLLPPGFFYWPLSLFGAFWLCLVKKIDVIVAQSPLAEGWAGAILKKIFKIKLIVEIHGDWEVRKFFSKFAKFSFKGADKIRGVANYLIDKARRVAPQKSYFLFPTFTDLDDFLKEKDIRFDNFILFVGRAHKIKGVEYLTKAFSEIKKDFPEFDLVLVGEGLPGGKLPLEEVKNKMKNCYCLVLPSLSEGLPRVLMEAMALGKPVIASNIGGIPDLIKDGENGFLFEVRNINELAEKLRILLADRNLAINMGKKGKEFIQKKFSNEKYLENYIEMIYS